MSSWSEYQIFTLTVPSFTETMPSAENSSMITNLIDLDLLLVYVLITLRINESIM